jgi:hypothetical protein
VATFTDQGKYLDFTPFRRGSSNKFKNFKRVFSPKSERRDNEKSHKKLDREFLKELQEAAHKGKITQFAEKIMCFPKRQRFNQDLDESVKEIKS